MYRCKDCGGLFEDPILVYDDPSPAGVALTEGYYIDKRCPMCGSDAVEEANECAVCGEYIAEGETVCETCKRDIAKDISALAESYKITIGEMESALTEVFEW